MTETGKRKPDFHLMKHEGFIRTSVAAKACGVNPSTVYRWIQNGKIVGSQVGRGWFVQVDDLLKMFDAAPGIQKRIRDAARAG